MAAQSPAQKVVDRAFRDFVKDGHSEETLDSAFQQFVAELLLRQRGLDDEEILSGIVDGREDGGVDALYVFLDGVLVQSDHAALESEDRAVKIVGDGPRIEVLLVQVKNKSSWQEVALDRLLSTIPTLLEDASTRAYLSSRFNDVLAEQAMILRTLSEHLSMKFPKYSFRVVYATKGTEAQISQRLRDKSLQIENSIASLLTPGAAVACDLIGAEGLYELAGAPQAAPAELRFRNTLIREEGSYVGIADIADYLQFVRNEAGDLRSDMFESNVRDFEGSNVVNKSIHRTVATSGGAEFWWQNNGVTVLGRRINAPKQTLTIEQPLIVNGLQTTHVLHRADKDKKLHDSRRSEGILVRVIESDDDEVRDQVIAGTNRQTRVEGASLYATDALQTHIERYFFANDWYYERRKNRYKNLGKPASRRVSIHSLAQAIMTLDRGEPDVARARPTTVITNDYRSVFNTDIGVAAYLKAAQMLASVSSYLRSSEAKSIINNYSNVRFYLLLGVAMTSVGARDFSGLKFRENHHRIDGHFEPVKLSGVLKCVARLFDDYERENPGVTRDAMAKSADFRRYFLEQIPWAQDALAEKSES